MDTSTRDVGPSPKFQFLVIWASLLVAQGMIVIVSQTATSIPPSAPDTGVPASVAGTIPPIVFSAAGIVAIILATVLFRVFMVGARRQLGSAAGAAGSGVAASDRPLREIASRTLVPWILRWALLEMVTMLGFVQSMLSATPAAIYPFAAVGLIGFAMTVPTEGRIRASLR